MAEQNLRLPQVTQHVIALQVALMAGEQQAVNRLLQLQAAGADTGDALRLTRGQRGAGEQAQRLLQRLLILLKPL